MLTQLKSVSIFEILDHQYKAAVMEMELNKWINVLYTFWNVQKLAIFFTDYKGFFQTKDF